MLTRQYLMFMADGSTVISSVGEITRVKCNGQLGHVPHDEEDRPAVPWPRQVGGHTETGARHVASARGPSLPHRAGGRRPKGQVIPSGTECRTTWRQVGARWPWPDLGAAASPGRSVIGGELVVKRDELLVAIGPGLGAPCEALPLRRRCPVGLPHPPRRRDHIPKRRLYLGPAPGL